MTVLNIPNSITLLRIVAVPVFLSLLVDGRHSAALIVFVLAGLSDAVDGAVARITNTRTQLGEHLDPLADKLLLLSAFITLGILGAVPAPLMIVVLVRDVVVLSGCLLASAIMDTTIKIIPSMWGKVTTFLQLVTVGVVLLSLAAWVPVPPIVLTMVFVAAAAATVISGIDYVIYGLREYQDSESETPSG